MWGTHLLQTYAYRYLMPAHDESKSINLAWDIERAGRMQAEGFLDDGMEIRQSGSWCEGDIVNGPERAADLLLQFLHGGRILQ